MALLNCECVLEVKKILGDFSSSKLLLSFKSFRFFANQAKEAQSKHKVFPVPVGDSKAAMQPLLSDSMTFDM